MTPGDVPELFVYRPGALGDALLARTALAALRRAHPARRLVLATNAAAGALLCASGLADRALSQDDPALLWLFDASGRSPAPQPPPDSAVLWTADPEGVVGDNAARAGIRRVIVARSRPDECGGVHAADHLVRSLGPLGVPSWSGPPPGLTPGRAATSAAAGWLAERGVRAGAFAVLHPGSGAERKNWPAERFVDTAGRLEAAGLAPLFSLGPADAGPADAVHRAAARRGWQLAEGLAVEVLAALLARGAVYLGNDSGVSHLAAAVGAPTVALFGSTDPAIWAPQGARVRLLRDPGWLALGPAEVAATALAIARPRDRPTE